MRFLIDAQLPPALGQLFINEGHDSEHVQDANLVRADDPVIWQYATRRPAVIVSKDEDFAILKALDPAGPQMVWLRVGNCSNRALLSWFRPLLPDVVDRLNRGEGLIEVI